MFERCDVLTISRSGSYDDPRENQVSGICFGALQYHEHKMSVTTSNFFAKKQWPKEARIFFVIV